MIFASESFLARQQGGALLGGGGGRRDIFFFFFFLSSFARFVCVYMSIHTYKTIKNINILYLSNPAFFVSLCSCVFHILSFLTPRSSPRLTPFPPRSPWGGTMEKHMCTHVFIPPSAPKEGLRGLWGGVQYGKATHNAPS